MLCLKTCTKDLIKYICMVTLTDLIIFLFCIPATSRFIFNKFELNLSKLKCDLRCLTNLILNVYFVPPATSGLFSPSMSPIGLSKLKVYLTFDLEALTWGLKPLTNMNLHFLGPSCTHPRRF